MIDDKNLIVKDDKNLIVKDDKNNKILVKDNMNSLNYYFYNKMIIYLSFYYIDNKLIMYFCNNDSKKILHTFNINKNIKEPYKYIKITECNKLISIPEN